MTHKPNKLALASLRTQIGHSIYLETCVYNASGPRTGTAEALSKLVESQGCGAVLTKSATLEAQSGNPLPRTWHHPPQEHPSPNVGPDNGGTNAPKDTTTLPPGSWASFNSEGLPNQGIDYYIDPMTMTQIYSCENASRKKKPYMVSISGKTLQDNLLMLTRIQQQQQQQQQQQDGIPIAAIELNLACPNVIGKPIIAYDFEQLEQVLEQICSHSLFATTTTTTTTTTTQDSKKMELGVKLPPYFDSSHFQKVTSILNRYKSTISFVSTINTLGNALAIDSTPHVNMPYIRSNQGFAGLSGPAIKYTALANVRQMFLQLDPSIRVVGVGGISSGKDAFEMILCGAKAVQIGTCHWIEGTGCFDRICQELQDQMKEHGFSTIDEFSGRLQEWNSQGVVRSREYKNLYKKQDTASLTHSKGEKTSLKQKGQGHAKSGVVAKIWESNEFWMRFYQILSSVLIVILAMIRAGDKNTQE